jgi:hypothetical protein
MPPPGKRKSLALYEVINERGLRGDAPSTNGGASRAQTPAPTRPAPSREQATAPEPSRISFTPGQAIRVPVGYLFFSIALLILVGVGGYTLGYHQHERVVMKREADERARMRINDPLDYEDDSYDTLTMGETGGSAGTPNPEGQAKQPEPRRSPEPAPRQGVASRVIVVEGGVPDPRRVGMNYIIFARYVSTSTQPDAMASSRAAAIQAAEFVASHGYEVGVYPSGRVFRLLTLRPFEGTGGDDYKAFARDLKQIGKRFKAKEGGAVDFADLWPEKFKG